MTEMPNRKGPVTLAQGLLSTLQQEYEALEGLCTAFDQQLDALRARQHEALEQATQDANVAVTRLGTLQLTRQRKMRLLGRVLGVETDGTALPQLAAALNGRPAGEDVAQHLLATRTRIRERAAQTQQRCDELAFTLQYAVDLSREMMRTLQRLDAPPPARTYTAAGGTSQTAPPSSFLNKLG